MPESPPDPPEPQESFFDKGGAWVLVQFFIMGTWLMLTPLGLSMTRSPQFLIPSILLLAVGGAAGIGGVLALGRNRTPFPKPRRESRLAQTGVYAFVRHPLYLSLIALSFGWASLWESSLGVVLSVVQLLFLDAKARREERWLRQTFPDYPAYAAKVRRLIPWVY